MLTEEPKETSPVDQAAEAAESAAQASVGPETQDSTTVSESVAPQDTPVVPPTQATELPPANQPEEEPTPDAKAIKAKELENELTFEKVQEARSAEGAKEKKPEDVARRPTQDLVTDQRRQQIEKLFVKPPDYDTQLQPLLEQTPIGVVYGPDYVDCTLCAEHLGLLLAGQITSARQQAASTDPYAELEQQVEALLRQIEDEALLRQIEDHPLYSLASNHALRLDENLRNVRMHGDTPDLRNDRNQITLQLNRLAHSILGLSLKQIRFPAKATAVVRNFYKVDWLLEEQHTLIELAKGLDENNVYLVRNPIRVDADFCEQIHAVSAELLKRKAALIFVQQSAEVNLLGHGLCYVSAYPEPGTDAEITFVRYVFRTYFTFYGAVIPTAAQDLLDDLVEIYLKVRFPIAGFINELRSLTDEATDDEIRMVAERMGKLDQPFKGEPQLIDLN